MSPSPSPKNRKKSPPARPGRSRLDSSKRKPLAKAKAEPRLDTRDLLIKTAKNVFASKGFAGATVKDLADAAGVNISLVSYHFGGKEGLYRNCLESFGSERVEVSERILRPPHSVEEFKLRLRLFAEEFMSIHLNDPDSCKLINTSLDNLDEVTADVFKNVFIRVFDALLNFLESAKQNRILQPDLDIEISTLLMFGSLMHLMRSQDLARLLGRRTIDDREYRDQVVEHWVESFTRGLIADRSQKK